jgi:hypothetical protein
MDQADAPLTRSRRTIASLAFVLFTGFGCGGEGDRPSPSAGRLPYATEVLSFEPGEGAGFGQGDFPDVVLGPPNGQGVEAGSLDVLSLGLGGTIELGFQPLTIVDGEGPDFVVFENACWPGGDRTAGFAEIGEVSVSEDGETWLAFVCAPAGEGDGAFPGCAGWTPTLAFDPEELVPLEPELVGGDAFDLADVGLARARFVRVRDLSGAGAAPSAGFDLDAVGVVHAADR